MTPPLQRRRLHGASTLGLMMAGFCLGLPQIAAAQARPHADLGVVKPVRDCAELARADIRSDDGSVVTIASAGLIDTPKGAFCKVLGTIAPSIGFEVDLPAQNWTQRFLQGGCGGLCGMTSVGISNATTCAPALNGEFVVAGDDMGHKGQMGSDSEAEFAADPQKRIDFAYRGNHETAVVAKALIKVYYGQGPRYSYFTGCSDGGREALMETQRFPDDFDGVSAGDPAALFQIQNSFYHAWNALSNQRADGTNILMPGKLNLLHQTVLAACDTLSGVSDGLLQDPRACHFDPGTLICAKDINMPTCLTTEELAVVRKLYSGASDAAGNIYTFGALYGGEAQWNLPATPTARPMSAGMASRSMEYVILPEVSPADGDVTHFAFDPENFARVSQLAPLYNATNTNLKPFAAHGGKLILWHGLSDTSITPGISIAYYQGVQAFVGAAETDRFMRLFLLPGVGHCGGGDGYDQIDTLSALMAWTELGQSPEYLIAGKSEGGRPGPGAGGPPPGPGGPGGAGGPPPGGGPGGDMGKPYVSAGPEPVATRPVYAYPNIPHYTGKGDPKVWTSYEAVKSPVALPQAFPQAAIALIGPDNQKTYSVVNGKLTSQ
ncbi:MAG: tannase/feruloyl esterase family alpha/beta hydrolase [Asticcacaulis sp.]|uniref:tannase/feruloyl esterase family alpha/beta hydrolase n=1 Tax=Asticcacaulis sp. TaxID=1872648 RepID=UPI0039E2A93B